MGLLTATSVIANSLFSPIIGYASDRHGLKYYIIAGPLFTSIFLSLIGILPNYYSILAFLFLGNLSIAAYHPASAAIAGHFGGSKKGLGSSIINFGGNFGNALGALMIILIIEKLDPAFTPMAMVPGIIMAIVLFKLLPDIQYKNRTVYKSSLFKRIRKINKTKIFLLFIIMLPIYCLYIVWITLVTYMPLCYTDAGITPINMGIILFFFGALGGSGGLISGFLFDHIKKGSLIIQCGFAIAVPLLFFTFRTQGLLSIILFIAGGFFLISIQPVCIRMTQDLLPENISLASSLILGFSPGIAAVTMIFLGKAADIIGIVRLVNYEMIFIIFTILIFFLFPSIEKNLGN